MRKVFGRPISSIAKHVTLDFTAKGVILLTGQGKDVVLYDPERREQGIKLLDVEVQVVHGERLSDLAANLLGIEGVVASALSVVTHAR